MKNYLIPIFLLSLLLSACSGTKKSTNKTPVVEEKKEPKEKSKGDSDIVIISPLGKTDYKIKVGQKISYSYKEHGSVGISAEYDLSDASVLVFKDKIREYKNPDKSEYPGGDEATVTLIFKAAEKGIVDLVVRSLFRGKTENEFKFKITVE
jgi:hypothetical protein